MERVGRESIYRDRNAVQTKSATSLHRFTRPLNLECGDGGDSGDGFIAARENAKSIRYRIYYMYSLGCSGDHRHYVHHLHWISLLRRPIRRIRLVRPRW
jgi:NAD(P)H-hydrate repair Nnr-like enzyme with NAD(P)H-hydrate epimerase domain